MKMLLVTIVRAHLYVRVNMDILGMVTFAQVSFFRQNSSFPPKCSISFVTLLFCDTYLAWNYKLQIPSGNRK